MSPAQKMNFLQDGFQMTAIALMEQLELVEQTCQSPWRTHFSVWQESSDWGQLWVQQLIEYCSPYTLSFKNTWNKNLRDSDQRNAETTRVRGAWW